MAIWTFAPLLKGVGVGTKQPFRPRSQVRVILRCSDTTSVITIVAANALRKARRRLANFKVGSSYICEVSDCVLGFLHDLGWCVKQTHRSVTNPRSDKTSRDAI